MAHDPDSSVPFCPPGWERCYHALVLLRRGFSLDEIASVLPNGVNQYKPGVSTKSAEIIIRQGARSLLTGVLLGRPTPSMPLELWPPAEVRESILEHRSSHRSMLAHLRAWLECGSDQPAESSLSAD